MDTCVYVEHTGIKTGRVYWPAAQVRSGSLLLCSSDRLNILLMMIYIKFSMLKKCILFLKKI